MTKEETRIDEECREKTRKDEMTEMPAIRLLSLFHPETLTFSRWIRVKLEVVPQNLYIHRITFSSALIIV